MVPSLPTAFDDVQTEVVVALPVAVAFDRFVHALQQWWPREYTWGRDVLVAIGIDPRPGGLCFELGPHGFRCDWGRVLEYESPARLVLAWQIGPHREPVPDPLSATRVAVTFVANGSHCTVVAVRHSGFGNHGAAGADYRAAMASPRGWPFMLACFAGPRAQPK